MASVAITTRDDVAALIVAANPTGTPNPPTTLPLKVTVVKKYVAIIETNVDAPESGPPLVTVMGHDLVKEVESRTTMDDEILTDVVVQRKVRVDEKGEPVDAQAAADLSNLLYLVESIAALCEKTANLNLPGVKYRRTNHRPLWVQSHLLEHGLFTSVITVTHHRSRNRY